MTVVTAKEVAIQFNAAVADLMNKGYVISPFTENGSYSSTKTHIDMINPKDTSHILRVWMIDESMRIGDTWFKCVDVMGARVKRYEKGRGFDGNVCCEQCLWPNYGETIYEKPFYLIKIVNDRKIFSDNLEEAKRLVNMRCDRAINKPVANAPYDYGRVVDNEKLPENFIDAIMARINKIRGLRRATASCIESVQLYKYNRQLRAEVRYRYNDKSGIISLK